MTADSETNRNTELIKFITVRFSDTKAYTFKIYYKNKRIGW